LSKEPSTTQRNPIPLANWTEEKFEDRFSFGLRSGELLHRSQSEYQEITIVNTEFGETLLLDGAMMTASAVEHYYHEMLVHPALTTTPCIKKVLVIGGGDGGTVREVLRYPEVEQVTLVELDCEVVFACRKHLRSMAVPWDDDRLAVVYADGAEFVRNGATSEYDVILVDGADPVGPAAVLFSSGFYADCKRRLKPFGTLASQTESPIVMREDFLRIVRTMREHFGRALPVFGPMPIYPGGSWSWTIATDREQWDHTMDFNNRRMVLAEQTCKYYNRYIHRAAFAMPNDLMRELG